MAWHTILEQLRWHTTGLGDRLAQAVAEACRQPVLEMVSEKACRMSRNEARGYISARCSHRVALQTEKVLREHGLRRCRAAELAHRAVGQLVTMILHDIQNAAQVQPARRKAA